MSQFLYVDNGYATDGYVQTGITINWDTRVIFVPRYTLSFAGGNIYNMNVDTFRLVLKDLEDSIEGIVFPTTHNHNPPVTFGGVTIARSVEIINGYTVTFEDVGSSYIVSLFGANNNIVDVTNLNNVSVRSSNSAGLAQSFELEQLSFDNHVTMNQATGQAGTGYPLGNRTNPVNNVIDACLIADIRSIDTIFNRGISTFGPGDSATGRMFEGLNLNNDRMIITPGAMFIGCDYVKLWVTGNAIGGTFQESFVENNMTLVGGAKDCGFLGTCSFYPAIPNAFQMFDCHTTSSTAAVVTLIANPAVNILMHRCSGRWILQNVTTGSHVLNMTAGEIELHPSCTGGTVTVRGTVNLIDNSNGTVVIDGSQTTADQIATTTWERLAATHVDPLTLGGMVNALNTRTQNILNYSIGLDMKADITNSKVDDVLTDTNSIINSLSLALDIVNSILKYNSNRTRIDKNDKTLTVYDDDGVTPITVFDLKDFNGVASITEIAERVPQ